MVEKARGFEPPRGILHYTCHPCPLGDGIPLGENYRLPFGNHRDTNLGQTKNIQKIRKNEDFKNTREHRFISQLVITIGFR